MDRFTESLNRLKDIHEKEVLGLQSKLLELNSERCRDAQRLEELFAKNQQLREQQKALKENVRVLENRLRAGLCDRCMVTQELARKRQLEFENSHLQSLQHIFLLTHEMNVLKEENTGLKEEVKRLRGLEDQPRPLSRDGISDPPSPLLLPSPGSWKQPGGHEEAEDEPPSAEKSLGYRTSPVARISPSANLPELRAPDMSPQHVSNQLHGTIAVVRPGPRVCPPERGTTDGTPPPPTRNSPPSPPSEHSLPLDSFLRAPRTPTMTYGSLKRCLQAGRLCLLNRHLALHPRSPRSMPPAPTSPLLQGPQAGEPEAWEGPAGLLDLEDTRDARLEGALHLLLARQQRQARVGRARLGGPPAPGETPPSLLAGSNPECPESQAAGTAVSAVALTGGRPPRPPAPGSPRAQDYAPDKPLDLSDRGRSQDVPKPVHRPRSLSPPAAHAGSPGSPQDAGAPANSRPPTPSPCVLSNCTKRARAAEPERPPTATDPPPPLPGHRPSLPSPGGTGTEARGRPKPPPHPQWPDADGHQGPRKASVQTADSEDPEEPDSSDSEVALSSEAGTKPSVPGEGPGCFCTQECGQSLQQKRKWDADPGGKAPKKPTQGRRKPQEPLTDAEGPQSPRGMEDSSPSPSDRDWQQT
ncbi:RBBP8 N-terminal-like protein isoform X2 [Choloepus didactylus]|uniref:RBBP8 N-terminal-like protein isoform X2 n=1 Tax=Choloepus didactylus TaxID=27675 RepID=UPI00189D9C71|nr:RBBP8 N-terminal-like protein isoform X2 [Choloepus didactylus]